jgi:HAD superfamily phosphoserine phosphatase-like hydrolase
MNNLIIVDLDKTLTFGDSVVALSKVMMEKNFLYKNFWKKTSILDSDNHYFSLKKKQELNNLFFSFKKNIQNEILDSLLKREEVYPIKETISIINDYRKKGFLILVTSASLDFLVLPILNEISFEYDFLHCSSFKNSSENSILVKLNNSGLNKLQSIKDHYNRYGIPKKIIVFSDHFSDLPILLLGHKSYVVKNRKNLQDDWSNFFEFESIFHN